MKPNTGVESSVHVWTDARESRVSCSKNSFQSSSCVGSNWVNQTVIVHCDNLGAVSLVNTGYSRVQTIRHRLRSLFFIRARFSTAIHRRGDILVGQQPDWMSPVWTRLFVNSVLQVLPQPQGGTTSQGPDTTCHSAKKLSSNLPSQSQKEAIMAFVAFIGRGFQAVP